MSTPKPRKNRRKHEHQQTRFDGLQRKLEQGPFAHQEIVVEPENAVKMSDMLEDFVEPYRDTADTKDAYQKLLTLGMMAWNAALLPAKEQQNMLQQLLDRLPHTSAEDELPRGKPRGIKSLTSVDARQAAGYSTRNRIKKC